MFASFQVDNVSIVEPWNNIFHTIQIDQEISVSPEKQIAVQFVFQFYKTVAA